MKAKLSITDQFLWDIYNGLEKVGDVAHFFLRPRRTMRDVNPDSDAPWNKRYLKELSREQFAKLLYYLKRKNYIRVKNLENKKAIILTKQGLSKALKTSFVIQDVSKREDGKWVMLIFDVPEKYKNSRDLLRSILHNLGYKIFQKSVWITPYDISEKTERLLQFHDLDKYVKIFLIEEI